MNASQPSVSVFSWPHSKIGELAVVLTALFLLVTSLNLWTAADDQQNALLVFATFLTALGAVASSIVSAVAIVRQHERSLLVYLSLLAGVAVIIFLAIEVFVGHD
jgi:hypothetical protein